MPPVNVHVTDAVKTALVCTAIAFIINSFDSNNKLAWTTYFSAYTYGFFIHTSTYLAQRFSNAEGLIRRYLIPVAIGFILATASIEIFVNVVEPHLETNLSNWIYFALLANAIALTGLYLAERKQQLSNELKQAHIRQLENEKALSDAKIQILQSQIEPHFLFNTMANIKASIHTDPNTASEIVDHFSSLLRQSLKRSQGTELSLSDELELCRAYLQIQSTRLNHRFKYSIKVDGSINTDITFPSLLIQPLIENAITHGVENVSHECEIIIVINYETNGNEEGIRICVQDNGIGLGNSQHASNGLSLDNIRKRLAIYAKDAASLNIVRTQAGWTVVTIMMPYQSAPD